jgi:diguanylate cyclase (GGDEF)-like protein
MKNYFDSIGTILIVAIFFSFLAPLTVGFTYSLYKENIRYDLELNNFKNNIFDSLETGIREAVLNLEPAQVKNAVQLVITDPRIIRIKVYSSLYGMTLADVRKNALTPRNQQISQKRQLELNGEKLGYIEIVIDKSYHNAVNIEAKYHIIILFAAMFICGLTIISPVIYFLIIRPTKKLMLQANELSKGNMDLKFDWNGRGELSELGNTFERMRCELKSNFEQIRKLAVTDELTQIPNRRAFFIDAQKALSWSNRYHRPLTLALMDIDHFKKVNDTYGHDMGDEILRDVAKLIINMTRATDIFARYGGEEFIICMPETDIDKAQSAIEKIRAHISAHTFAHKKIVTACFGLASNDAHKDIEQLIHEADQAMYEAKNSGRNRVVIYKNEQTKLDD